MLETGVVASATINESFSPSTARGVSLRWIFDTEGEEGRDMGRAAFKMAGKGGAFCGVKRSMTYERKSSSWSLRCGRRVENKVEVVRRDEASRAGESDRVS